MWLRVIRKLLIRQFNVFIFSVWFPERLFAHNLLETVLKLEFSVSSVRLIYTYILLCNFMWEIRELVAIETKVNLIRRQTIWVCKGMFGNTVCYTGRNLLTASWRRKNKRFYFNIFSSTLRSTRLYNTKEYYHIPCDEQDYIRSCSDARLCI